MVRRVGLHILGFLLALLIPIAGSISPVSSSPVVAIAPSLTATESPDALLQQGIEAYESEQFVQAIQQWQQASQAFASQENWLGQALSLSNLALAHQQLGQLINAEQTLDQSLEILQQISGESNSVLRADIYAKALMTQGRLNWLQGQMEPALTSWQQAEQRYAAAGNLSGSMMAQINQAKALQALGLSRQAEEVLQQVYQHVQQTADTTLQVKTLLNLGIGLRQIGQLDASHELLQLGLMIETSPSDESLILLELGNTERAIAHRLLAIGREQDAALHQQAALEFYQQAIALDQPLQAQLNLLSLQLEIGQPPDSAQLNAIQHTINTSPLSRSKIYAQIYLAEQLIAWPDQIAVSPQQIAQSLSAAVQDARSLQDRRAESYALGELGKLYEHIEQWHDAQQLTQQALLILETVQAPEIRYRWEWQLGRLANHRGDRTSARIAYEAAMATLASVRSDLLSVNPDIQFSFRDKVEPIYREYIQLLLSSEDDSQPDDQTLQRAIQTVDTLQLAELENYLGCTILSIRPIDAVQTPNAAIIYPIPLSDRLAVIAQFPDQPDALTYHDIRVDRDTSDSLVQGLRRNLATSGRTPEVIDAARTLYDWMIRPLEPALEQSSVDTLIFVLDGSLRNVPMSVLFDGEQYLIEKGYAVAIAPRLEIFSPSPADSELTLNLGGVGIAQEISGVQFPLIEKLEEELDGIAQYVDTIPSLTNESFTAANIRQQLQDRDVSAIHWKTHGIFSSDPAETYIVGYDERITASVLNDLIGIASQGGTQPLELLVLSACETAQGDNRAVLGLAGLAARTGTRSVLSTLWVANDVSNTEFMKQFYELLAQPNMTKAQALRQAQLSLIQDFGYTTPHVWANYVLIGNWL